MLPLRSVGRSNFDKGLHNLTTLIQKRHILMRTAVLYIYVYIYAYVFVFACKEHIMHSAFNLLVFYNSMFAPLLFFLIERAMYSPEK